MREAFHVVVVGGGPAGVSAAEAAHEAGAAALLIERDSQLGGVLQQCIHDGFGVLEFGERMTGPEYKNRQLQGLSPEIGRLTGAYLHSMKNDGSGWHLSIVAENGVHDIEASSVVMATGCRERTDRQIFLHGDRPAGIFTAGQAQRLINIDGIMPGRRIVILGSGDIGMIMARRFVLEGADVLGVYEAQGYTSGLARNVAQCLEDWDIPLHLRSTATEVHGRDRLRSVSICPVTETGHPDLSAPREVECDTLVLSVGLIPENDMLTDMGLRLDPATDGPCVTQERRTGVPGLFVCGNALLVYDLVDYVSECGRTAGRAAARHALEGPRVPSDGRALPLSAGDNVRQVIPQLLDSVRDEAPVLYFRPARPMDRVRLRLMAGDRELDGTRLSYLRPAEMVRYPISDAAWAALRDDPAPVRVVLEVSGDS